jgi:hypothetical protein
MAALSSFHFLMGASLSLLAAGVPRYGRPVPHSQKYLRRAGLACAALLAACDTPTGALHIPAPDVASFELEAYPILLRDCGFPECHGSTARFFRVFGPGRTRLLKETLTFAPATPEELEQSYARARSMLAHQTSVVDGWLLRKPLAVTAGGAEHGGEDKWGRNVYETTDDLGYVALYKWAISHQQAAGADAGSRP